MKCPNCGKWNQANLPHCVYCGEELRNERGLEGVPAWQLEFEDKPSEKSYIRVDEQGEAETAQDPRDILAGEMAELKSRKLRGEEKQRMLRQEAARRGMAPSGSTVHTTSNRSTFFSSYDNPDTTLRPVAPELVEKREVDPNARQVFPPKYRTTYSGAEPDDEVYGYGNDRHVSSMQMENEGQTVYDGYRDTSAYLPAYANQDEYENSLRLKAGMVQNKKPRRNIGRRLIRVLVVLGALALAAGLCVMFLIPVLNENHGGDERVATVTPTIRDDLAAHTITIPGEDGQRITIRELRSSAIVTGGVATFDIPDHTWYDTYEDYLQDTMAVTLTPFIITESGKQEPLEVIHYDIDIPLSPIELNTPDSPYQVVSTAMYNIVFYVREGSTVLINGTDYSDLVNTEGGKVSFNATVQPIGENTFDIVVRSQYCRENSMTVTLYREKQEIPLDLASDIASTNDDGTMTVRGTTLPGAVIKVLSPYSDLDITNTASDGSFSFVATFDKIGTNTIVITADYPGKATTRVEHMVTYVPNVDIYSRKAWDIVTQYTDLMDNLSARASKQQIYVCSGTITSIETTKPQRAFMDVGKDGNELLIYVENSSKTTWEVGKHYQLFADAYGMYDSKPWLIVRYTYQR